MERLIRSLPSPLFVCAPMVAQSELAFRRLVRRRGVPLCFTPMISANGYAASAASRAQQFDGGAHAGDRPLIAQVAGQDGATVARAAALLAESGTVDGVDINAGCPQRCAKRGGYGAFLLAPERRQLLLGIVAQAARATAAAGGVPLSVKVRVLDSPEATLLLARQLQDAGAAMLTVHGRTAEQCNTRTGRADWDVIRAVKASVDIPVLANGGVASRRDALRCLAHTGADGVMSSEALLESPGMFAAAEGGDEGGDEGGGGGGGGGGGAGGEEGRRLRAATQLALAREYVSLACDEAAPSPLHTPGVVKGHLFKLLHSLLEMDERGRALRPVLGRVRTMDDVRAMLDELERVAGAAEERHWAASWYMRRRGPCTAYNSGLATGSADGLACGGGGRGGMDHVAEARAA